MGDFNPNTNERISSLIDGRVPAEDREFTFDSLLQDPQAVQTWHIYQVVGDVMRSPELAPCRDDFAFGKIAATLGSRTGRSSQRLR